MERWRVIIDKSAFEEIKKRSFDEQNEILAPIFLARSIGYTAFNTYHPTFSHNIKTIRGVKFFETPNFFLAHIGRKSQAKEIQEFDHLILILMLFKKS